MKFICIISIALLHFSCQHKENTQLAIANVSKTSVKTFEDRLSEAAISIIDPSIDYDPAYFSINIQTEIFLQIKVFAQM